jgi:hypothetical protein
VPIVASAAAPIAIVLFLSVVSADAQESRVATVSVSFVNSGGVSLDGTANLTSFVSEQGTDFAARFIKGVGTNIPFGTYRLEVDAEGFEKYVGAVNVGSPKVFVKVGLAWYGLENDLIWKDIFRGTISGRIEVGFCRASGVYLRWQYDATINPKTGWFDFGAVRPGSYSLVCVIDKSNVSFGVVNINASSPPLYFEVPSREK